MTRFIPLLLVVAFPFVACEGDRVEEFPDAEEFEAPALAPPAEVAPPLEEGVAAREIDVTNPMPHAMIVTATVDGETVELGSVPANASAEFTVQARAGATVELEARDEPDTHRVRGSVTVSQLGAQWTIRE